MAFPKIGLTAYLDLKNFWEKNVRQFQKDNKDIADSAKKAAADVSASGKDVARSWGSLVDKSKALQDALNKLDFAEKARATLDASKAFKDLGDGMGVNIPKFEQLIQSGASYADAIRGAATSTAGLTESSAALSGSLTTTTLAIGALVAALAAEIAIIKKSINEYLELATEVRALRYEMGLTAEEASALIAAEQLTGVSSRSLQTSIGYLNRQLVDYQLRQAEGKESTTRFTRSLSALGISIRDDVTGEIRPAIEIFRELNRILYEHGPSAEASAVAMNVLGRGAANLLPLMYETNDAFAAGAEIADKYNSAIGPGEKLLQEWNRATTELKQSTQGLWNSIAREAIPQAAELVRALADVVRQAREAVAWFAAMTAWKDAVYGGRGLAAANTIYAETLERMLGAGSDAAREEEKLQQAQANRAGQNLINAESQEILNERLKEAKGALNELADTYAQRKEDLVLQFGVEGELGGRRWEDILIRRARELADAERQTFRRQRDMYISYTDRREDILRRHARRQLDLEEEQRDKLDDFYQDAQRKREDLEREHYRKLRDIRQDYFDTIGEAARRNDAVAVVRAMRERARGERDERQRYSDKQEDLQRSLDEQLKKLREQTEKQKEEQRNSLQEQLEDLEIAYARQKEALQRNLDDQLQDRRIAWERQRQDFNRAKERQFADLKAWYEREKAERQREVDELIAQGAQDINRAANVFAQAMGEGMGIMVRAGIEAMQYQQQWIQRHQYMNQSWAPPSSMGWSPDEQWTRRHSYFRQAGGIDVVSGPTRFVAGEAGPEVAAFFPLTGNVSVNHKFSRMPIDFGGLPSGVDTAQIESMVYQAMIGVVEQLGGRR